MKDALTPTATPTTHALRLPLWTRLARHLVLAQLQQLQQGCITITDGDIRQTFGRLSSDCQLSATVSVHDPRFYNAIVRAGDIGAGAAYIDGFWSCDDLTALVRILLRNRAVLDGMASGLARLTGPLRTLYHALHRNTVRGSRRNIAAHYDLGNDFFALFLDETMTYSCGIFTHPESTLQEASLTKLDRICRKLQLSPADHVVEIGTGWGSFAIYAAQHYGCRVTTTTISQRQYELARQRVAAAGVADRVTVLCDDYRALTGQYDKLVSIEMIEAVGHAYYDTYFRCCSHLLKPDGMMLLQAITIADQRYEQAKRSVDFIQRYIFPGSCIPSITAICNSLTRATDLRLFHLEDLTPHYATTLRHWRERFLAHADRVRALGYPEAFIRMWEFYLCYCEGGFHERAIGDVQMLLTKPQCRRAPLLPPL
ncbi:MAG: cyclopropane-fatty-acyl-phospholipid synthase family protein [Candidatus Binatia bacterium]|nr:cyclopropane-fatty-acyl-phospholipid synthase family protein [Candidatus Binatia bacterium]